MAGRFWGLRSAQWKWVSWQWRATFQSTWLDGSEPSPKATGRDILRVVWTTWPLKLKETQALEQAEWIPPKPLLLTPSCLCPPSPDAASGLLPREVFHILLTWVLPRPKQEAQNIKPAMHTPSLLTSPGSLHLSSSSSSRQNWPPMIPRRKAPVQCGNAGGGWRWGYCSKS